MSTDGNLLFIIENHAQAIFLKLYLIFNKAGKYNLKLARLLRRMYTQGQFNC